MCDTAPVERAGALDPKGFRVLSSALLAATDLNTDGINSWVISKIIPLILLVIGLGILMGAKKAKYADTFATIGIVILGLVVIGGAGVLVGFGDTISETVFK